MAEYRPIRGERLREFRRVVDYGFNPHEGVQTYEDDDLDPGFGEPRAMVEDDELVSVCRHYGFTAHLRGGRYALGGVGAVSTPPEHRRRGLVRKLARESLVEYRERGWNLAALWPFDQEFYRRLGWAPINRLAVVDCAPEAFSFASEAAAGEFRRLDADDWALVDALHEDWAERYALTFDRSEEQWRRRIFEGRGTAPYVYAWLDDAGEPRAYLRYTVEEGDDGRTLKAREAVFEDDEALRNLLRFCYHHDSQLSTVRLYLPTDVPMLDLVPESSEVEYRVQLGSMFRLVDAPAAVEMLEYDAPDGSFTLELADPLADWNDGTFAVTVADGEASVDPVDGTVTPDVRADVGTLSQVVGGYHAVTEAERLGSLRIDDPTARTRLSAMFPPLSGYLIDGF